MDIQPDDGMTAAHADYTIPIALSGIAESEAPFPPLSALPPAGHAAELALRRSQDRLQALVRAVGQITWTTNAVGLVVEDLPTWRAYTGQSAQEIKGWGWMSAVHPADREGVARLWSRAVVTKSPYEAEYRLRRSDGVYRTFLVRGLPVLEADDGVREWVGCHTDITERQQLTLQQARLLKREQKMRRELEAALDALLQMAEPLVALPAAQGQTHQTQAPAPPYSLVRRLAELARRALGCKRIKVLFLEPEMETFQPVVAVGITSEQEQVWRSTIRGVRFREYFSPESIARLVAGEALVVDQTALLPNHPLRSFNFPAFLAVPVRLGGRLIGGMVLDYSADHIYSADEIALASTIARVMAMALDREHLAAQSGQRGAELATASLAMRAIAQQWDIDQVLGSVLEQARGVLGTTMAALLVIDPAHLEFKLFSACGVPAEIRAQIVNLKMGMDSSLGRATLSGTVQVVEDVQTSRRRGTPLATLLAAGGVGSFVAVPLHAQYHPAGVLVFASPLSRSYDAESRHFLRLLGDIFAVAINAASLQERLRASNAQLVTASLQAQQRALTLEEEKEGRETFISLVAHELRSPLTTLSGYIQLLGRASMQEPERREGTLHTMREQANRLKRLIDDLLDVSRIASGHFALQPEVTDLAALTRKVVEEAQATTNRHTIRLDLASASIIGVWDRQRLAQVLNNLLSNALKYSPQGGEIQVVVEFEPESLQVTIRDSGIGLQPEEIALLFRPYARLGRTRKTSGSGLGLYITRGIIEAHGGRIGATSAGPDCGSEFRFTLPYQVPSSEGQ